MAEKEPNTLVRLGQGAAKFFRDCKNELKKIVWPTPKPAFKGTGVVLAMTPIIGLFIFGLDTVLMSLLGLFTNIAK